RLPEDADETIAFLEEGRRGEIPLGLRGIASHDGFFPFRSAKSSPPELPPFRPDSQHKQKGSSTGLGMGSDHYHLYWGGDRAALLEEVTNWPTYYPSSMKAGEIVSEMKAN